jgi:DNA-binding FrmR family transcriptional regulator
VLQQIAACRGAVSSLLVEIMEGEIRFHVLSQNAEADSGETKAADNLVGILRRYIKSTNWWRAVKPDATPQFEKMTK